MSAEDDWLYFLYFSAFSHDPIRFVFLKKRSSSHANRQSIADHRKASRPIYLTRVGSTGWNLPEIFTDILGACFINTQLPDQGWEQIRCPRNYIYTFCGPLDFSISNIFREKHRTPWKSLFHSHTNLTFLWNTPMLHTRDFMACSCYFFLHLIQGSSSGPLRQSEARARRCWWMSSAASVLTITFCLYIKPQLAVTMRWKVCLYLFSGW